MIIKFFFSIKKRHEECDKLMKFILCDKRMEVKRFISLHWTFIVIVINNLMINSVQLFLSLVYQLSYANHSLGIFLCFSVINYCLMTIQLHFNIGWVMGVQTKWEHIELKEPIERT